MNCESLIVWGKEKIIFIKQSIQLPIMRTISFKTRIFFTILAWTTLQPTIGKPIFIEFINQHSKGIKCLSSINGIWLWQGSPLAVWKNYILKLYSNIPAPFNPMKFNSLRFFRHARKGVHVLRIARSSVTQRTRQFHTPVAECGGIQSVNPPYNISIFRVNPYAMSKEAFFAEQDRRRTVEAYEWWSTVSIRMIYDIKPWLAGFVDEVGLEKALILLSDVGYWMIYVVYAIIKYK